MTVKDFVNLELCGEMVYRVVDIYSRGCMTDNRKVELEDYRQRVREQYGDAEVKRFEVVGKRTMILYCEFK